MDDDWGYPTFMETPIFGLNTQVAQMYRRDILDVFLTEALSIQSLQAEMHFAVTSEHFLSFFWVHFPDFEDRHGCPVGLRRRG